MKTFSWYTVVIEKTDNTKKNKKRSFKREHIWRWLFVDNYKDIDEVMNYTVYRYSIRFFGLKKELILSNKIIRKETEKILEDLKASESFDGGHNDF